MEIKDIVKNILDSHIDMNVDSVEKIIYIAYYMGKCEATISTSDAYASLLAAQRARAKKCRYHNMAMAVQGNVRYLYMPDYNNWIEMFEEDETEIKLGMDSESKCGDCEETEKAL